MSKPGAFVGRWRVVEMELWDQDAFDLLGAAHFTFGKDGCGSFQFIAVQGDMDCRHSEREGKPRVDFTWEGNDECDPANGRGWAIVDGDGITCRIYFHSGDDSAFTAKRDRGKRSAGLRRRNRP